MDPTAPEGIPQENYDALLAAAEDFSKTQEIANQLMGNTPDLPYMTAIIMAQDIRSRERADKIFEEKRNVWAGAAFVGSYNRFDWLAEKYFAGFIDPIEWSSRIAADWRGADPDDTNPVYLKIWNEISALVGDVIVDEKQLPDDEILTVYRGQPDHRDKLGIAWSLDKEVAERFARGAAYRTSRDGYLAKGTVHRNHIIAYITGRNEEEIIVDPSCIRNISWEYVPVKVKNV